MNKLLGSTLISVFVVAASASAAIAQPAQRGDWRPGAAHRGEYAQRAFSQPTQRVEARLAYIKTALKISAAQMPQWDAYANVMRKNAQDLEKFKAKRFAERRSARHQRPNAIERLERAQSVHATMVVRINELLAVEKPLYAALSPEQRKVADVVLNPRFGFRHFAGRRGEHRRG